MAMEESNHGMIFPYGTSQQVPGYSVLLISDMVEDTFCGKSKRESQF